MKLDKQPCIVYTLNGEFKATATDTTEKMGKLFITQITSDNGEYGMQVFTKSAHGKFEDDSIPTFYQC